MTHVRHGRTLLALLFALPGTILVWASEPGRLVAEGDFLQLESLYAPSGAALGVVALVLLGLAHRWRPWWRAAGGAVLASVGAVHAFQGARVVSTLWLFWGRFLVPDPGLALAVVAAGASMAAGVLALVEGTALLGPEAPRARRVARWTGLGPLVVALAPWAILWGEGSAPLLFNDLTEPRFSNVAVEPTARRMLLEVVAGFGAALAGALLQGLVRRDGRAAATLLVGPGVVVASLGVVDFVQRVRALDRAFEAGSILPGPGVASLLVLAGVALAALGPVPWRSGEGEPRLTSPPERSLARDP